MAIFFVRPRYHSGIGEALSIGQWIQAYCFIHRGWRRAPDIPRIPAGDSDAGQDYSESLSSLKAALGSNKSVSLAAPASYWYLKAFHIKDIGARIGHIVLETYDFHGQWDYNSRRTFPGCTTGNCVRSHVKVSETKDTLSMITIEGFLSNKITVGVSIYGCSFQMAQTGCTGPICSFTGSPRESNAAKGRCTGTSGYISNTEINDILAFGKVNKGPGYDQDYDPDHVAEIELDYYEEWDSEYKTLDRLNHDKDVIPYYCMDQNILHVETKIVSDTLDKYQELVSNDHNEKFEIYENYTIEQISAQINVFAGSGNADDFFMCEDTGYHICCSSCQSASCLEICDKLESCPNGRRKLEIIYPTVYKDRSDGIDCYNTMVPKVAYTLEDSYGFYEAIKNEYGIEKS
ncbi:glycoside hydrolase superfamily [Mariannaea sp. PMI_226]|nr:glycoside hydrolase superfamily [Mariannaea sp. PMI_226]